MVNRAVYALTVPIAKKQHVTIISNREMTPEAWARLEGYIALQRDIWAEPAASADTLPEGQDAQQGLAGTESGAVAAGQTPKPSRGTDHG